MWCVRDYNWRECFISWHSNSGGKYHFWKYSFGHSSSYLSVYSIHILFLKTYSVQSLWCSHHHTYHHTVLTSCFQKGPQIAFFQTIHLLWVVVSCIFVVKELRVAGVPLKVGIGLAKNDFFGITITCVLAQSLFEYVHDGLTWGKCFESEKYCFHKWLWVPFVKKKIYGKISMSYGQKQNFRGTKFSWEVFKGGFVGDWKVTLRY